MIRVRCIPRNNVITEISITGDFFLYPEDALWIIEDKLRGIKVESEKIRDRLAKLLKEYNVSLVGSTLDDFVEAIYNACKE